jgi:hypothetical protein
VQGGRTVNLQDLLQARSKTAREVSERPVPWFGDPASELRKLAVGDTGIEPVTSSVSANDREQWTGTGRPPDLREPSADVRQRTCRGVPVVTQLVTHSKAETPLRWAVSAGCSAAFRVFQPLKSHDTGTGLSGPDPASRDLGGHPGARCPPRSDVLMQLTAGSGTAGTVSTPSRSRFVHSGQRRFKRSEVPPNAILEAWLGGIDAP